MQTWWPVQAWTVESLELGQRLQGPCICPNGIGDCKPWTGLRVPETYMVPSNSWLFYGTGRRGILCSLCINKSIYNPGPGHLVCVLACVDMDNCSKDLRRSNDFDQLMDTLAYAPCRQCKPWCQPSLGAPAAPQPPGMVHSAEFPQIMVTLLRSHHLLLIFSNLVALCCDAWSQRIRQEWLMSNANSFLLARISPSRKSRYSRKVSELQMWLRLWKGAIQIQSDSSSRWAFQVSVWRFI